MLPSQAKKALTDYFLERLEASELNYRGDPKYNYDRAHQEFFAAKSPGDGFWTTATFTECFTTAYKEYEALYPLRYMEAQTGYLPYREGVPKK